MERTRDQVGIGFERTCLVLVLLIAYFRAVGLFQISLVELRVRFHPSDSRTTETGAGGRKPSHLVVWMPCPYLWSLVGYMYEVCTRVQVQPVFLLVLPRPKRLSYIPCIQPPPCHTTSREIRSQAFTARNLEAARNKPHSSASMDFSSSYAALRSLKKRTTTTNELRILAEKLEKPFSGEIRL